MKRKSSATRPGVPGKAPLKRWMTLNDREVEVRFKTMKHLRLKLSPEGQPLVSAPRGTSLKRIRDFVLAQEEWIVKGQLLMAGQLEKAWRFDSFRVDYLGREYGIRLEASKHKEVILQEDTLRILTPLPWDTGRGKRQLEAFFKTQAARIFKDIFFEIQEKTPDFPLDGVTVKPYQMKRRLGTCYPGRRLVHLNTRLIHMDRELILSVLWHELVHLEYPDHGPGFYTELKKRCPGYEDKKKLLNRRIAGYL
ncbi:MAG: hypothetical protein AVO33_06080 [delta proteobacterium ML8_F1]|nr:MAG: hypothetical protein AVO33_06080 [delta proteobacterium ML8_F1]